MLVLSRGASEEIRFPTLGISIKIVRVDGKRVRLGIDAPKEIEILRGELLPYSADQGQLPKKTSANHHLRNQLQTARLALEVATEQIGRGMHDEALEMLARSLHQFDTIESELCNSRKPWNDASQPATRRALVVEDDENERELLAGYLSLSGFEVDTAGDGLGALVQLSRCEPPSVVLLDMNLPKLDGRQTLHRIRRQKSLCNTRIIAVSGMRPDEIGVEIGPHGVDFWFQKPVDPKALVAEIERELEITV